MKYRFFLLLIASFYLSACGDATESGSNGTDALGKSTDFIYKTATELTTNVNDANAMDGAPEISANGLELYFHSTRLTGANSRDIYVSKRQSKADNWGNAQILGSAINSDSDDRAPDLSQDGLSLIFSSDRVGGSGQHDLYISFRTSLDAQWGMATNLGVSINTEFIESGPSLSADGLTLYFHSDSGGAGSTDLFVVARNKISDPWRARLNLTVLNSAAADGAPELSSDGLTLYFHSSRTNGVPLREIWRSTRSSIAEAWSNPVALLSPIKSTGFELTPGLSNDWKTLYFTRSINGVQNIWQAEP